MQPEENIFTKTMFHKIIWTMKNYVTSKMTRKSDKTSKSTWVFNQDSKKTEKMKYVLNWIKQHKKNFIINCTSNWWKLLICIENVPVSMFASASLSCSISWSVGGADNKSLSDWVRRSFIIDQSKVSVLSDDSCRDVIIHLIDLLSAYVRWVWWFNLFVILRNFRK